MSLAQTVSNSGARPCATNPLPAKKSSALNVIRCESTAPRGRSQSESMLVCGYGVPNWENSTFICLNVLGDSGVGSDERRAAGCPILRFLLAKRGKLRTSGERTSSPRQFIPRHRRMIGNKFDVGRKTLAGVRGFTPEELSRRLHRADLLRRSHGCIPFLSSTRLTALLEAGGPGPDNPSKSRRGCPRSLAFGDRGFTTVAGPAEGESGTGLSKTVIK